MSTLFTKDTPDKLRHPSIMKVGLWTFLILGSAVLLFLSPPRFPAAAQQSDTATPSATLPGTSLITVTYIEPINVRTGPGSFDYPVIGSLDVGATAVAVGRSPAGEWIEIIFPAAPRGTAWVYAANVTLSPGALLPVVEPPPTPAPAQTATLNPTYVAAFQILPTTTRLPTFTPPPPLAIPTYPNSAQASSGKALTAWAMVLLGVIGLFGLIFTSIFRRR
jgi:hypothetical protein